MGRVVSFRGKDAELVAPILREVEIERMKKREHAICLDCFAEREPGQTPKATLTELAECCSCGSDVDEVTLYKCDPAVMNCQGITGVHAKD